MYRSDSRGLPIHGSAEKLARQIRNWILPVWSVRQSNPGAPTYDHSDVGFINHTCRSWVELKNRSGYSLRVDRFATLDLVEMGLSLELWLDTGKKLVTPIQFLDVKQRSLSELPGVAVSFGYGEGSGRIKVFPLVDSNLFGVTLNLTPVKMGTLNPVAIYLIIRPFNNDGIGKITAMEYRNSWLMINRRNVLRFKNEPDHCFFTDAEQGDVTQYLPTGEGNLLMRSKNGGCTGLIGFSGLGTELNEIKWVINPVNGTIHVAEGSFIQQWFGVGLAGCPNYQGQDLPTLATGTEIDELYRVNVNFLQMNSYDRPIRISPFQILTLGRCGLLQKSRDYLTESLKRVRWDGAVNQEFGGGQKFLYVIIDYIQLTGDYHWAQLHWGYLKRIASWLSWYWRLDKEYEETADKDSYLNSTETFENAFWSYASLKKLVEIGEIIGRAAEVGIFKEHCLKFWTGLNSSLLRINKGKRRQMIPVDFWGTAGGETVTGLASAYPLQLWERGESIIRETLHYIVGNFLYRGGLYAPLAFKGIDPGLTARLGQVLVREGLEYVDVLRFLLQSGSGSWCWPDRIHPLSGEGIGITGHSQEVANQVLLFLRSIFLIEEEEDLWLLPGVFSSSFWENPHLDLEHWPTYFGNISIRCRTIRDTVQIDFSPEYRNRPEKILINTGARYRFAASDAVKSKASGSTLELSPDLRTLRLRKLTSQACLDNTFMVTI